MPNTDVTMVVFVNLFALPRNATQSKFVGKNEGDLGVTPKALLCGTIVAGPA